MRVVRVVLALAVLGMVIPASAAAHERGAFRTEVSALGMGNTGLAVPERGCVWAYNPALLTTVDFDLTIPSVDLGANGKTLELLDFLEEHKDDFEGWEDLTSEQKIDFHDKAREFYRKPLGFQTAPKAGFATRNLGVAVFADTRVTTVLWRQPLPLRPIVSGAFETDIVAQVGSAKVVYAPVSVGLTLRYVNRRINFIEDIDPAKLDEVVSTIAKDTESYNGWGVDLGVYYPTPYWGVAVGATYHNVLGGIQVPDPENPDETTSERFYRNLTLGASWKPIPRVLVTAEAWDVLNDVPHLEAEDQFGLGGELDLSLLKLRGGVYGGKITCGAGLNLVFFNFDFATYMPEVDRADMTDEEQRVYIGQVEFGW